MDVGETLLIDQSENSFIGFTPTKPFMNVKLLLERAVPPEASLITSTIPN
jgi:hypothetical protein